MIADRFGITLAGLEPDRVCFADHARRHFRFRPALPGEAPGRYLVRRRGKAFERVLMGEPGAASAFELGAHEELCVIVWGALEHASFPLVDPK